jgi:hypothetical protein
MNSVQFTSDIQSVVLDAVSPTQGHQEHLLVDCLHQQSTALGPMIPSLRAPEIDKLLAVSSTLWPDPTCRGGWGGGDYGGLITGPKQKRKYKSSEERKIRWCCMAYLVSRSGLLTSMLSKLLFTRSEYSRVIKGRFLSVSMDVKLGVSLALYTYLRSYAKTSYGLCKTKRKILIHDKCNLHNLFQDYT